MVNFANAIEQGISAAADAKSEQDEINDVVKSLASSVEFASRNAVTLVLTQRALKTSNDLLHSLAFVLSGTRYHALVLKGKNFPTDTLEVAKWGQEGKGYPVKIGISSEEYDCPNREALERALLTLVATSEFGDAIKTVAAQKKNAERTNAKPADKSAGLAVKTAANPISEVVAKPAAKAAGKPASKAAARPAVKAPARPAAKAAAKPAAKTAAKPASKAATKPAAKAAARPAAKSAINRASKAAVKPAAKAAAKPAAKAAAKPAAKAAAKPAAKAVVRPAAKAVAKPASKGAAKPAAKAAI